MSRAETVSTRAADRTLQGTNKILVKNLAFGVNLYSGAITKEDCLKYITNLDNNLDGSGPHSWISGHESEDTQEDRKFRSAFDFEIGERLLGPRSDENKHLYSINDAVLSKLKLCIDDYGSVWDISINYYEPLNFVKYNHPNSYFKTHIDHSPFNARTVSAVAYLNENYDGGELVFPRLDGLTIKPKMGDIIVFPSTYMYEHESKSILRGTKYAVAAMTDYSERA